MAVARQQRDSRLRRLGEIPGSDRLAIRQMEGVGSVPDVAIAGLDQPALIGERDRLSAVVESEFGEDAGDVRFDRCGTYEQVLCDLDVARSRSDGDEDFPLPAGEAVETRNHR